MYLLSLLIIDKLFLGSINTLDLQNNLAIGIRVNILRLIKVEWMIHANVSILKADLQRGRGSSMVNIFLHSQASGE